MDEKPVHEQLLHHKNEPGSAALNRLLPDDALEKLFNISLDILCVADFDGHYLMINSAFENTLGYSREVLLKTPFTEFIHPDDRVTTLAARKQLVAGKPVTFFENRYRCKDGTYKWFSWNSVPLVEEGLIYAVARDITVQKETQRELVAQHDLFDNVLSNVPVSIFWKDRNSVYLGSNDRFARDAGVKGPEEFIGKTDYDLAWTKEQADFYRACDREVMDNGEPMLNIEESQLQADGNMIELLTSKVPLTDEAGQVTGILGVYMDITKRKQVAHALKNSERRFRTIFNSTYQLLGLLDRDGIVLEANQTALDFGGIRQEDVVGRPFWDLVWWKNSDKVRQRLRESVQQAAGGRSIRYEEEVLDRDRRTRIIDFTLRPVMDEQGRTIRIIPEGRDITESRQAEQEKQRHQQEMAHIMRLGTMGEMASGLAHELNQPLTALVSYCGVAASLVKELPSPPQQLGDILDRATEQAHRAGKIIRHLREFVSKGDNRRESLDLNELVHDVMIFLDWEFQESNVTIEFYPGERSNTVKVDKIQIEQVLINLVRNSLDAIRNAEIPGGQVIIRSRLLPDDLIEVTVEDNGPGIDAAMVNTIFDPFQTNKESGMGIGLSLSRTIIEAHDGNLWVDKNRKDGALLGFVLPAGERANRTDADSHPGG